MTELAPSIDDVFDDIVANYDSEQQSGSVLGNALGIEIETYGHNGDASIRDCNDDCECDAPPPPCTHGCPTVIR